MNLKRCIPIALRHKYRPRYIEIKNILARLKDHVISSEFWPKPTEWSLVKNSLIFSERDEYLQIAKNEFGLLQKDNEILSLIDFLNTYKPNIIGEIGLKFGGNTFLFQHLVSSARKTCAIDLNITNKAKLKYLAPQNIAQIFIEGSSYDLSTVAKVRRWLGTARFDFLFIDGDHTYQGVLNDLICYFPLVRQGGIIAFHDIVPDECGRYGKYNSIYSAYGGEVYVLWRRLRMHFIHQEFVADWSQLGYGIGIIVKSDDDQLCKHLIESFMDPDIGKNMPLRTA